MKKIITGFLLIILLSTQYPIIFASLQEQEAELDIKVRILEIFENRANVWNDFLLYDYESSEDLISRLEGYSTEPMISKDKLLFDQLIESPSSYERINKLNFHSLRVLRSKKDEVILKGDIVWEIGDPNNSYIEKATYKISLKRTDDKWYLSDYYISD